MPRKPLNKKIINKIISLHKNENLSCIKIGERLGISQNTASKYLRQSGYDIARTSPLVIPADDVAKMWRLKNQGYTIKEISKETGHSATHISFYTTEKKPRSQNWDKNSILKLLVESDFDCAKAAKKINRNKSNIYFLVRKFGLSQFTKKQREKIKKQKAVRDVMLIVDLYREGLNVFNITKVLRRQNDFVKKTLKKYQI